MVSTHVLKNALIPILTVIGLNVGTLLSGAVVAETVFTRPGIGRVALEAILARDYPVIQGVVIVSVLRGADLTWWSTSCTAWPTRAWGERDADMPRSAPSPSSRLDRPVGGP